jgi:hypothetical protein
MSDSVIMSVAPIYERCYTGRVPTTRPRYAITDTGEMTEMLDLAARRWPEVHDRRQLLIRLAGAGRDAIAGEVEDEERTRRRDRQLAALARGRDLVDVDALLGDGAWR